MLDTIAFIYTQVFVNVFLIQLLYGCIIAYFNISSWHQFTSPEAGFSTFLQSKCHANVITELFNYFQLSNLFLIIFYYTVLDHP